MSPPWKHANNTIYAVHGVYLRTLPHGNSVLRVRSFLCAGDLLGYPAQQTPYYVYDEK